MQTLVQNHLEEIRASWLRVQSEPTYFVSDFLGDELWDKQEDIINSVRDNPITTVRSCHGIGKSFIAARTALWFLNAYPDSIVVTTAPTFRQVENIIWRYMRSAYKQSKRPLGGKILKTRLEVDEEWYAIGISSDDPDKIQGFHPKSGHILVIIDEAAGVDEDVYVAADAIMSSLHARMLMIGNPTSLGGRFYESQHTDPKASKIAISCFDTPNFKNNGIETIDDLLEMDEDNIEIVAPHLITPQWVKDKVTRWGVDSPLFQARCLGQFPSAEINTIIPLNYIEAATEPERKEKLLHLQNTGKLSNEHFISADVARYGDDKTVISERYGYIVEPQVVNSKENTSATTGRIEMMPPAKAIMIDCDGLGGGVADQLEDDLFDNIVQIYNNSSPALEADGLQFANLRSQLWWNLRELFMSGQIYIPKNWELISQLASVRYSITRKGIAAETKDDIKKRLHISPDRADSLMYLFADYLVAKQSQRPSTAGKTMEDMYKEALGD